MVTDFGIRGDLVDDDADDDVNGWSSDFFCKLDKLIVNFLADFCDCCFDEVDDDDVEVTLLASEANDIGEPLVVVVGMDGGGEKAIEVDDDEADLGLLDDNGSVWSFSNELIENISSSSLFNEGFILPDLVFIDIAVGFVGDEGAEVIFFVDIVSEIPLLPLPPPLPLLTSLLAGIVIRLGADVDDKLEVEEPLFVSDDDDSLLLPIFMTSTIKLGVDNVDKAKGGARLRTISPSILVERPNNLVPAEASSCVACWNIFVNDSFDDDIDEANFCFFNGWSKSFPFSNDSITRFKGISLCSEVE